MTRSERGQASPRPTEIISITIGGEYKDPTYPHTGNVECLQIFQSARAGFMASRGITPQSLEANGLFPLMTRQTATYRGQSYPGDAVDIRTSLEYGRRRLVFYHEMIRDGRLVVQATCDYLLINSSGRPQLIPAHLITQLTKPTSKA